MYLTVPVSSQVMSGWSAGAALAVSASVEAQSKVSNWACSSGVTQARSLPLLGVTLGVAAGVGSALGSGVAVSPPTDWSVGVPATRTGRSSSFEEDWMRLRVSSSSSPGMATTMFCPPCVLISASETPEASTRWRMIVTAWSSCSCETVWPLSVFGARIICVPPSRSSASFGVHDPPPHITPAALMANRPTMMTASQERLRQAFLTGVDFATAELSFLRSCPRHHWRGHGKRTI